MPARHSWSSSASSSSSRREWLGRTALAVSAMALAPHVRGQEAKKKIGFCVVGIGSLAKNQIIPGLAKCENAKLVALVSGHAAEKAPSIVEKYGLNPKYVYSYDNYDAIKDNPAYFKQLRDAGADIEAHTLTHPSLKGKSYDFQKREICGSADQLKTLYG